MKSTEVLSRVCALTSRQHGVVTSDQLSEAGASRKNVRTLLKHGLIARERPNVFRLTGTPRTPHSALWVSLADAGQPAVISHTTAASFFGLPGFQLEPHHVVSSRVRRHQRTEAGLVIHEPVLLKPRHLTEADGVPATTPARTMFDLSAMRSVSTNKLARTIDACLSRNLASVKELDRLLVDLARRGRPGIRRIRPLIHERLADYVAPESGAEHRFMKLLTEWQIHGFERQVNLSDSEGWIGRVDFVHRAASVVVEIDTALFHGSLTDRRIDKERRGRLRDSGWTVLAVDADALYGAPSEVREAVQRAVDPPRPASQDAELGA